MTHFYPHVMRLRKVFPHSRQIILELYEGALNSVLIGDTPKADAETRIQVQAVCLWGDPREHPQECRQVRQGKEGSQYRAHCYASYRRGNWKLMPLANSGVTVGLGYLFIRSCQSLVESAWGCGLLIFSPLSPASMVVLWEEGRGFSQPEKALRERDAGACSLN